MIMAKAEDAPEQARRIVEDAPAEDRTWALELVEAILVYKLLKRTREEIKMILELQDPELKQSRFYQEVFAEGRQEGRRHLRVDRATAAHGLSPRAHPVRLVLFSRHEEP